MSTKLKKQYRDYEWVRDLYFFLEIVYYVFPGIALSLVWDRSENDKFE